MKFNDIPQLTREGAYCIDVDLDYGPVQFQRYADAYGLDLDVDFQRGHVWTDEQATAFVEHLLSGGRGSNLIRFNKPNWMRDMEATPPMVCVDGKQRLTACLRFAADDLPAFGRLRSAFEGQPRLDAGLRFMVNDLLTRAEVLRWYLEINGGGTPHSAAELNAVHRLLDEELAGGRPKRGSPSP